jgi:putative addiction module component (TIGR02574 family)
MITTLTTEELKAQLSRLDDTVRAELAEFLIDSLGEPPNPHSQDEWDAELNRRLQEIRSGTAVGEPAEIVMRRLREKYS